MSSGKRSKTRCTWFSRFVPVRHTLFVLAGLLGLFGIVAAGCASTPFGRGHPSREAAIAHCVESTPPESVPYGDRFAACMEDQGWVYTKPRG